MTLAAVRSDDVYLSGRFATLGSALFGSGSVAGAVAPAMRRGAGPAGIEGPVG